MWAIENQSPFSADRAFVRDQHGAEIWLVAIRATFEITPGGKLVLAKVQEPVALAPEYLGKPGASSLRCDIDLPRLKTGTDVLVNATAYSPKKSPTSEVEVKLKLSRARDTLLEKTLIVSGDAAWDRGMGLTSIGRLEHFEKLPIRYERAFGGAPSEELRGDEARAAAVNPVGVGIDKSNGARLPNVRFKHDTLGRPSACNWPAGFGALGYHWLARREHAGTYDDRWERTRKPLPPSDFSDEYFSAAPPDQRVNGFLRGGESIELTNMTPSGHLSFTLPKVSLGVRTWISGSTVHQRTQLHTVLIEPDRDRVVVVWHSSLECHHTLYTLKRSMVYLKTNLAEEQEAA